MMKSITINEQVERQQRVDFARGNVALEGMTSTKDDDITQRYLTGEIQGDEYVRLVLERIESEQRLAVSSIQ